MASVTVVTCDHCGANLTGQRMTGEGVARRLVLDVEVIPADSAAPLMTQADFDLPLMSYRPHHFCGRACLRGWVARVAQ